MALKYLLWKGENLFKNRTGLSWKLLTSSTLTSRVDFGFSFGYLLEVRGRMYKEDIRLDVIYNYVKLQILLCKILVDLAPFKRSYAYQFSIGGILGK